MLRKKLELVSDSQKAQEVFDLLMEITSYREEILKDAFKKLPDHLSTYGLNDLIDSLKRIENLVEKESKDFMEWERANDEYNQRAAEEWEQEKILINRELDKGRLG